MTHRGRRIRALILTLVLLGFVLNAVYGKTRSGTQQSAGTPVLAPAPRPVQPLFVPRPASLINGELSAESSPQGVAKAFASTYAGVGPGQDPARNLPSTLPRVAPGSRARILAQLLADWTTYYAQHPDFTTPQVSTVGTRTVPGSSGAVIVTLALTQPSRGGKAAPVGSERRMSVRLDNQGRDGWLVTSVEMK